MEVLGAKIVVTGGMSLAGPSVTSQLREEALGPPKLEQREEWGGNQKNRAPGMWGSTKQFEGITASNFIMKNIKLQMRTFQRTPSRVNNKTNLPTTENSGTHHIQTSKK